MAIENPDRVHAAGVMGGLDTIFRSAGIVEAALSSPGPGIIRITLVDGAGAGELVPWMNVEDIGESQAAASMYHMSRISDTEWDAHVYDSGGNPATPGVWEFAFLKFSQGVGT